MFLVGSDNSKRGILIAIIIALLLVGFIFTNAVSYHFLKHNLQHSITETELPKASIEAYSEISHNILPVIVASSMMANDRYIQQWLLNGESDLKAITEYLSVIKQSNHALVSFLVSENSQQYYNSEGITQLASKSEPHTRWYFDFKANNKNYELKLRHGIDQTPTIFIDYKIQHQGKFLGVVGLGIRLSVINDILKRYTNKHDQNIYFINHKGKIISQSIDNHLTTNTLHMLPNMTQTLKSNGTDIKKFFEYTNEHGHFLLNLRYIPELDWWMLLEQEEGLTFNSLRHILYTNMLIGFATILVILCIISWLINCFHKKLETLATTDVLTHLNNRQPLEHHLKQTLVQNQRTNHPFSVLLIDIDRFKNINDKYGHLVGDKALQAISAIIATSVRKSDCVGRWGGEEFVVVGHNTTLKHAAILAEKIRHNVEIFSDLPQKITISIGVTQARKGDLLDSILSRADIALYQAKNEGRNCIKNN